MCRKYRCLLSAFSRILNYYYYYLRPQKRTKYTNRKIKTTKNHRYRIIQEVEKTLSSL